MATLPPVAGVLRTVLGPVAERAARATGLVQRASQLPGARCVPTLVCGWLAPPQARRSPLAQTAATRGVAITAPGVAARCSAASAACRRAVVAAAVRVVRAADPVAVPVLRRWTAGAVPDGTTIALPAAVAAVWPGCGGRAPAAGAAALQRGVRRDLVSGRLRGPSGAAGRAQDRPTTVAAWPLPPGALRLADVGFFRLAELAEQTARGVSWRSRWQPGTAICTPDGQRHARLPLLAAAPGATRDRPVRRGVRLRVRARLLAVRVPQAGADQRRRRLRAAARDQGRAVSATPLARCAWTVCVTNAAPEHLPVRAALVLARARWQGAVLFTRWQGHGRVDAWRSADPWRSRTAVYAKLLAAIVQHWRVLVGCWQHPDRSLVQAAQASQAPAAHLAAACDDRPLLCRALRVVARCRAGGRLDQRTAAPATVQLLLAREPECLP